MTATTAQYLFPYSTPTDPIASVDDTMKALAERLETVISGGDFGDSYMGAGPVNIAAGGTANIGSVGIPTTYRRRSFCLQLFMTPTAAASVSMVMTPNYADPRIVDPGVSLRQYTGAAALSQVAYWHWGVNPGPLAVTSFSLAISANAGLNAVRGRCWLI